MPSFVRVPDKISDGDFLDFAKPTAGATDRGKAWAWNDLTGRFEPVLFELAGVAASLLSAHTAAANPHPQYYLASGISAFGALLIDDGDAATARGTLGLGTAAVLNVGTSANNVVQLDGSARLPAVNGSLLTGVVATAVPGGSNTQVQYNSAGSMAGDAGLTYNAAADRLTIVGGIVAPSMRPASDSTTALQLQNSGGTAVVTVDTTNGRVGIGGVPTSSIDLFMENANAIIGGIVASNGADNRLSFVGRRSRGSLSAKSSIQNNDTLFSLSASGYDGTNDIYASRIDMYVDGVPTTGSVPQRISFVTGTNSLDRTERLIIKSTGYIGVSIASPTALLDLAASTTARASLRIRSGTAPTTPNDGDVWFDGTGFKCRISGVTRTFTVT